MDERRALSIAERWSGSGGLVPRGPKLLLGVVPATPVDVERHTGRRPSLASRLWKLEVGGRFLRSGGLVYPGGVPYPEELHSQTAVIANEVWLYVSDEGEVLGMYWWPDAVRRPIASVPRAEFDPDDVGDPADISDRINFALRLPAGRPWRAASAAYVSDREAIVFYIRDAMPDPINEMLLFECDGLSLRARADNAALDVGGFLLGHQPPYRRVTAGRTVGVGRDPGRALGPQTWPWPAELRWWENGVAYELKGFVPLAKLQAFAAS